MGGAGSGIAGDVAGDGGFQTDGHAGAAAEQGEGLGEGDTRRASRRCARPTRCRNGRGAAGITCGISIRRIRIGLSIRQRKNIGCRSICMSAASSMRCCICFIRGSGTRCCLIWGMFRRRSRLRKLVNQGMILGETEFHVFTPADGEVCQRGGAARTSSKKRQRGAATGWNRTNRPARNSSANRIDADLVEKRGERYVLKSDPRSCVEARSFKMSKSRGNVVNPDRDRRRLRRGYVSAL